jgi:hypothetical protein
MKAIRKDTIKLYPIKVNLGTIPHIDIYCQFYYLNNL